MSKKKAERPIGFEVRWDNSFPIISEFHSSSLNREFEKIENAVGGAVQRLPYPSQLNRPGFWLYVDENGLNKELPYNCWGIVGNFVIVKLGNADQNGNCRILRITDDEAEAILYELRDSKGYLDPACTTAPELREVFAGWGKRGEPPKGWTPKR